jgi:hypothetical protein
MLVLATGQPYSWGGKACIKYKENVIGAGVLPGFWLPRDRGAVLKGLQGYKEVRQGGRILIIGGLPGGGLECVWCAGIYFG